MQKCSFNRLTQIRANIAMAKEVFAQLDYAEHDFRGSSANLTGTDPAAPANTVQLRATHTMHFSA